MDSLDVHNIEHSLKVSSGASDQRCTYCRKVVFTDSLANKLTNLWERKYDSDGFTHDYVRDSREILQAGETGCPWCSKLSALVRESLADLVETPSAQRWPHTHIKMSFFVELSTQNAILSLIDRESGRRRVWRFNVHDPSARYPIFPALDSEIDFASQECFRGIESFMRQCDRKHRSLASQGQGEARKLEELPIRILDVAIEPPRVVAVARVNPSRLRFAALSYCWGAGQNYALTCAMIEQQPCVLDRDQIPATIADAITVTRRLGLGFLWIDALYVHTEYAQVEAFV